MAGLVGIFRLDGDATSDDTRRLEEMVQASLEPKQFSAAHRVGPLAVAYLGYGFEESRLGEHLDTSSGDIDVLFTGYLFNDEEVAAASEGPKTVPGGIRALYRQDPDGFVERLVGRFHVVVFDRAQRRLILANDRHGMVPLYVREERERFVFASSLLAHQVKSAPALSLDHAATALYLRYRHFVGEGSYFEGVSYPSAATRFDVCGDRGVQRREYWRFAFREEGPFKAPAEHAEEMGQAFLSAMARVGREPGPMAVPLSGGLDSRAISAQLVRQGRAFSTFTFGRRGCRDIVIAKAVTRQLDVPHHVSDLGPEYLLHKAALIARRTDGAYPIDHGHIAAILDDVTPRHDLVVDGLTGEMLSSEKVDDTRSTISDHDAFDAINGKYQTTSDKLLASLLPEVPSHEALLASAGEALSTRGHRLRASAVDLFGVEQRQRRFCLSGPRILGGDMRVFCPFWHNDYANSVFSAAPGERAVQRPYIMLHRKLWPEMARIRWNKTGLPPVAPVAAHRASIPIDSAFSWIFEQVQRRIPLLPAVVPYKGYERYNRWFRHDAPLRAFVREILLDERTLRRGIFSAEGIRQLIEAQEKGRARNADTLSQLIANELFFRQIDAQRS